MKQYSTHVHRLTVDSTDVMGLQIYAQSSYLKVVLRKSYGTRWSVPQSRPTRLHGKNFVSKQYSVCLRMLTFPVLFTGALLTLASGMLSPGPFKQTAFKNRPICGQTSVT